MNLVDEFLNNENSIYDESDKFDASILEDSKKLQESDSDDNCGLIPMAGGARAIAQACKKIISTPRQNSIYDTCVAMGLETKVNAMHNVVAKVNNMQEAAAALQKIWEMHGVRGSFMVTWEGNGKLYWAPDTPVDKAKALEYDQEHNTPALDLSNPRKYLTGGH